MGGEPAPAFKEYSFLFNLLGKVLEKEKDLGAGSNLQNIAFCMRCPRCGWVKGRLILLQTPFREIVGKAVPLNNVRTQR